VNFFEITVNEETIIIVLLFLAAGVGFEPMTYKKKSLENLYKLLKILLVGDTGIEPVTSCMSSIG